jgi:hypothetical protein
VLVSVRFLRRLPRFDEILFQSLPGARDGETSGFLGHRAWKRRGFVSSGFEHRSLSVGPDGFATEKPPETKSSKRATPLRGSLGAAVDAWKAKGCVDLDAIQLILEPAIATGRRQLTRIVHRRNLERARAQHPARGRNQLAPARHLAVGCTNYRSTHPLLDRKVNRSSRSIFSGTMTQRRSGRKPDSVLPQRSPIDGLHGSHVRERYCTRRSSSLCSEALV